MMKQIKLCMHDGKEFITTVENFNAVEIVKTLNDRTEEYYALGDVGFMKHTIKYFTTFIEDETTEPPAEV